MENDSIRASGTETLVGMWIDGKMRGICVSHEAIGAFLGFDRAAALSDEDRCDFVRKHLPVVVAAAKNKLRENPAAETVVIGANELSRPDGRTDDRRKGERRKGERRQTDRVKDGTPER